MSKRLYCLCEAALMIALAQILSYIKLWRMPWGGSIVLAMVPLVFFAIRWGAKQGLLTCCVYGILQFLLDGGFAISIQSIFGDYVIAYAVVGLAGLAKNTKMKWLWGSLIGGCARFVVHWIVGATVWAMYMPDVFLGINMSSPWFYSFLYNLCYMLPNIIVTAFVLFLLSKPMKKYYLGQDIAMKA